MSKLTPSQARILDRIVRHRDPQPFDQRWPTIVLRNLYEAGLITSKHRTANIEATDAGRAALAEFTKEAE